jgi:hypothetical protein
LAIVNFASIGPTTIECHGEARGGVGGFIAKFAPEIKSRDMQLPGEDASSFS